MELPSFGLGRSVTAFRCGSLTQFSVPRPGSGSEIVEVPAGHWLVIHDGRPFVRDDESFRRQFKSFKGSGAPVGCFLERADPYDCGIAPDGGYFIGKDPSEPATFMRVAVRIGTDGNPLCHASWPLATQARILVKAGDPAALHRAHVEKLVREAMFDPREEVRADAEAAAMIIAGGNVLDTHVDASVGRSGGPVAMKGSRGRDVAVVASPADGIVAVLREGGMSPLQLPEARHVLAYQDRSLRALLRQAAAPFLGEQELEGTLLMRKLSRRDGRRTRLERWASEGELLSEEPQFVREGSPVATSARRHWRRDGVDVVAFEAAGFDYAFAWPSPPEPKPTGP